MVNYKIKCQYLLQECHSIYRIKNMSKKVKRQRNNVQIEEKAKNVQDQINEEEIGKLPEKELRVMIIIMI